MMDAEVDWLVEPKLVLAVHSPEHNNNSGREVCDQMERLT